MSLVGKKSPIVCPVCKKERMLAQSHRKANQNKTCRSCVMKEVYKNGSKHNYDKARAWKGGIHHRTDGYIEVYLEPNDSYYPMTSHGYTRQHRLVMAKHLGRCLGSNEIIHHINGNKKDNRLENLQLTIRDGHKTSYSDGYSKGYQNGYARGLEDGTSRG